MNYKHSGQTSPCMGRRGYVVMSTRLSLLGKASRFDTSDSNPVGLSGSRESGTRSNPQNTYRVREADPLDQASSLLKADGAGSMTPKRSRQRDGDYFKVRRGLSNE